MLLIEAARISEGGGLGLLKLLLEYLQLRNKDFKVIVSPSLQISSLPESFIYRRQVNLFNRKQILKECIDAAKAEILFCFGNFPPAQKLKGIKVYTYFHRVGLLDQYSYGDFSFFRRLKYYAKGLYLKSLLSNTDQVLCQSIGVKEAFSSFFNYPPDKIRVIPFYDEERMVKIGELKSDENRNSDFIYVSNDALHKNHDTLLKAWNILNKNDFSPKLFLTIPIDSWLVPKIERLNSEGCQIVNLGVLPYEDLLNKLNECSYAIYPSLQESLGLGLVEATYSGLKVLGADLPYTYEIIEPSLVFDPLDAESIASGVKKILTDSAIPESKLSIQNQLPELVELLTP